MLFSAILALSREGRVCPILDKQKQISFGRSFRARFSSIPGILQARTLKGVARPTFKLWEKLHFGGSALCRKVTCPVPPLATLWFCDPTDTAGRLSSAQ